jgi:hypothetical protein
MDFGIYVIAVVIVLFYIRLYLIRRGKIRRQKVDMVKHIRQGRKAPPLPPSDPAALAFKVKSWFVIVPAILLMLLGIAVYSEGFLPDFRTFWWVPVAIGGILFIFGFE